MWKTFFVTFGIIFFAELGDKTQLTVMTMAAQTKTWVPVFLGSAAALAASSLLAAVFGEAITRVIPTQYIHYGAGALFVIIGGLLLLGKL